MNDDDNNDFNDDCNNDVTLLYGWVDRYVCFADVIVIMNANDFEMYYCAVCTSSAYWYSL